MLVYKLLRLKGEKLFPLFINKNVETVVGQWLPSECFPTNGFAIRQGWHSCFIPYAPHLKETLASGERRVWVECEAGEYVKYDRPESQGGAWLLVDSIKVNRILTNEEVLELRRNI